MTEAALSVSLSPLLPSSVEDETPPSAVGGGGPKRVRFQPFQPTHTVFTPRLTETGSLRYRKPDDRVVGSTSLAPPTSVSSIAQPNYDDFLRRVSVVLYQHIRRCEKRHREQQRNASNGFSNAIAAAVSALTASGEGADHDKEGRPHSHTESRAPLRTEDTFTLDDEAEDDDAASNDAEQLNNNSNSASNPSISSPRLVDLPVEETFREEHFVTPQYKYTFVRLPRVHPLTTYAMEKITSKRHVPSVDEIFRFCKNLFNKAQLSAECTIVCLIYIERLMEQADVPLLAATWRPIVLCGLLLASKVWQDLSSWNVEISNIYPQFSLHSINRLERLFLHHIQWDLYISATVYAKYYFALRSLTEKKDFRRRYNYTMRVDPPNSKRLEERSA
ncbi:hypothetical protein BBJ28_00015284, partial [Nothophytophthora sp. Chile5]